MHIFHGETDRVIGPSFSTIVQLRGRRSRVEEFERGAETGQNRHYQLHGDGCIGGWPGIELIWRSAGQGQGQIWSMWADMNAPLRTSKKKVECMSAYMACWRHAQPASNWKHDVFVLSKVAAFWHAKGLLTSAVDDQLTGSERSLCEKVLLSVSKEQLGPTKETS
ncbi:hypothetical protein BC567DRAFT_89801 [Phyllosticta citribraziliensis]